MPITTTADEGALLDEIMYRVRCGERFNPLYLSHLDV